ncbi:MAG TPA: AAA family ATPase [Sphaerochaeta sp.]|nr:AAA family ATPase [Sphaerochaeta sp.]
MRMASTERATDIRNYYGFKSYPFAADVRVEDMYKLKSMMEISEGIEFAMQQSMYFAIIGDVGSGKTTALRYSMSRFPSKKYAVINVVGGDYSFVELMRHTMACLGIFTRTTQQTVMLRSIYEGLGALREDGKTPILCLDEAHLLKIDVYSQLHLLSQQSHQQPKVLPMVICGQEGLFEKLNNYQARPIMSRILNGYNLKSLSQEECIGYIQHQLSTIGGGDPDLFEQTALIAVTQASGGLPRRVNAVCLKALKSAMDCGRRTVTAEDIRLASKDWWQ